LTTRHGCAPVPAITAELLRGMKLPAPDEDGDKEERGRVLVIAGAVELPGAAVLAGTAALRAGAGKLRIATCASVAPAVGVAVPEALAQRLPETEEGGIDPAAVAQLAKSAEEAQALLIGPGLVDQAATVALTEALLERLHSPSVVVDAGSLAALARNPRLLRHLEGGAVITPHAGEMAKLMDIQRQEVRAKPLETARRAAARFHTVVMLKGAETFVVAPDGSASCYRGGCVGLATSGSGDALAGLVAGLLARGTPPARAASWAAFLHGEAGNRLRERHGVVGFLARELLDEIPSLMQQLS
jgi:hydroxyethylthiazole kinase-like uncharacterized protein yjeF